MIDWLRTHTFFVQTDKQTEKHNKVWDLCSLTNMTLSIICKYLLLSFLRNLCSLTNMTLSIICKYFCQPFFTQLLAIISLTKCLRTCSSYAVRSNHPRGTIYRWHNISCCIWSISFNRQSSLFDLLAFWSNASIFLLSKFSSSVSAFVTLAFEYAVHSVFFVPFLSGFLTFYEISWMIK